MKQSCSPFIVLLIMSLIHFCLICGLSPEQAPARAPTKSPPAKSPPTKSPPKSSTQAPAALPPAQVSAMPGPTDIDVILTKAGHSTMFIRLLKATKLDTLVTKQLNNTNNGLTIFIPTDNAFTHLKTGSLNTYSEQQKDVLLQFHILPFFFSMSQFETVSNPLHTQAGTGGRFMLNVTVAENQLNISTGVVNATVTNTIYTDSQLAVYQVDKVLFPLDFVLPPPPAPAPEKPKKETASSSIPKDSADDADSVPTTTSGAVSQRNPGFGLMFVTVSWFVAIAIYIA